MSETAHEYHERDDDGRPFLNDGCPGCARHAVRGGITLDAVMFAKFWEVMMDVEYRQRDHYRSVSEKQLGSSLYQMSILLERHLGLVPELVAATLTRRVTVAAHPKGGTS